MKKQQPPEPLFAQERREKILQLLAEQGKLYVPELCGYFGVSPATIRSDLRNLEQHGRLRRTHGGAISLGSPAPVTAPLPETDDQMEKQAVGTLAASLVADGDTIALDCGATTFAMAKQLAARQGLTVVTYDLRIATWLEENTGSSVVLVGGVLRRNSACTTGAMTVEGIRSLNVDKAFLGADAFSVARGFTTPHLEFAESKRAMISIGARRIMLLNAAKLGRAALMNFASLADFEDLVTNASAGEAQLAEIQLQNPNLTIHTG